MTARELAKLLEANGWRHARTGKHAVYKKAGHPLPIVIPVHGNRDIPKGTLEKILKQAGLK